MSDRKSLIQKKGFMNLSDKNKNDLQIWYSIARGAALAALVVAITASVIIIMNYVQLKQADPLNSAGLIQLKENLRETPQDELLKNEIRAYQLLTRKAYFTGNWQIQTGGYLIVISLIILSICLKIIRSVRRQLPVPDNLPAFENYFNRSTGIQASLLSGGGMIMLVAVILAFITETSIPAVSSVQKDEAVITTALLTEQWPGFRGPGGNGISPYKNIPKAWDGSDSTNILWKTEIPVHGYSSPIITNGKLFVTGGNKNERKVFCLNAESGAIIWSRTVRNMVRAADEFNFDWVDDNTGFAAPTMATDGKSVVAIFATGDMGCFRLNGDLVWTMNVGAPDNHYAHSSSLIINKNLCFVQLDHHRDPKLLAVDMSNGSTVWQVNRKTISWSSPICVEVGDRTELILADSKRVSSYNPETGELFWEENCLGGEVGPSPAFSDSLIFVANEYAKASSIKIDKTAEKQSNILWQSTDNLPNTASPLAHSNLLLLASSRGIVTMLNANNGKVHWEHNFGKGFYSSPILSENLVYLTDLNGKTYIIRMSTEFEILAENELGEPTSCTAAMITDRLFIRGNKHVFCIAEMSDE